MKVTIPHNLPKNEAHTRVQSLIGDIKSQFGSQVNDLEEEWSGDNGSFKFSFSGHKVSGKVHVEDKAVDLDVELPMIALMFKGKIKSMLEEKGAKLLS